jgi:hypothetical protein
MAFGFSAGKEKINIAIFSSTTLPGYLENECIFIKE